MRHIITLVALLFTATLSLQAQQADGGIWPDTDGNHINAHGGNIFSYRGTWYWYGESRSETGKPYSSLGVSLYTSRDLKHWTNRGLVLELGPAGSDIEPGCIIERPKVLYNEKTQKFVMWFHLELSGKGYSAARYGIATSDTPTGPFRFVRSGRVNPGVYPVGFCLPDTTDLSHQLLFPEMKTWWTPEWLKQIERGMFYQRDVKGGQMARDMTIYVDDDGKAYHIYSSEDNLTLQIAQLTDDYMEHNGSMVRVAAGRQNEAPTIFKQDGTYWLITSGCTGWKPNAARMYTAKNIYGPWTELPNPCRGEGADKTFGAQGTYILHLPTQKLRQQFGGAEYVFMADVWRPKTLNLSGHLWIPIKFNNGTPVLSH